MIKQPKVVITKELGSNFILAVYDYRGTVHASFGGHVLLEDGEENDPIDGCVNQPTAEAAMKELERIAAEEGIF